MRLKCFMLILLLRLAMGAWGQDVTGAVSKELVFASDTQAPQWVETILRKPNNNRTATKMIFGDIAKRLPAAVYILGDVVSLGCSNKPWKPMDGYLDTLRHKGVKVHAALGNHEVMYCAKSGQQKFQQRFPDHVKTGYVSTVDSVAVVLLNSNFKKLSDAEDAAQRSWYQHTLDSLDADPAVVFIISGCHHSPYSNSKVVGSCQAVQEKLVPPFLSSKKSRLFLSGHSHNYEHFRQQEKDFVVIGGGGGLHQPLNVGKDALPDLSLGCKPMFHYLSIRRFGHQLQLTCVLLKPDFSGFEEGERFVVGF